MRASKQIDPEDPRRNPQTARGARPRTATEEVMRLLRGGADGRSIREHLKIPPSRLRRILNSPTLQKAVEEDRQVARIERILGSRGDGSGVDVRIEDMLPQTPRKHGTRRNACAQRDTAGFRGIAWYSLV